MFLKAAQTATRTRSSAPESSIGFPSPAGQLPGPQLSAACGKATTRSKITHAPAMRSTLAPQQFLSDDVVIVPGM